MKKLVLVLICLCLMQLAQATIIKCQAEDTRLITVAGNNWKTLTDASALGGVYITGILSKGSPVDPAGISNYKFRAPAGNYTLYVRYTKQNDGNPAYTNDSFFCSDSSFSLTAAMAERNNTPATGLDSISSEGGTYAWCLIDTANSYVQAADGFAYFRIAPREDGWRFDAFAFVSQGETVSNDILNNAPEYEPYAAYDAFVTPENEDGSVGTPVLVGSDWKVNDLTFNFSAGVDPAGVEPLNPAIVKHNLYLQKGAPADPNLYLVGSVNQTSATDPAQSIGPLSSLVPPVSLAVETAYLWQIEEVIMDSNSVPYPNGHPSNYVSPVWSFVTAGLTPEITGISDHMLTDENGDTSFVIETTVIANNFKWFKVVGEQDTAENAEADDIELSDSGIYSGTATKTLTIMGAASDGSDDAQVYAIAYNNTTPSAPSAVRWFWAPRLVNLYAFDTTNVVDGNSMTPDIISGYDMALLSNDVGPDVPSLDAGIPTAPGIVSNTSSLKFHNPRAAPADPNHGDAQYGAVAQEWAGAYKDITISAWVYNSGGSNWNRILDYGNDTDHFMMFCVNPGSINNAVRFAVKNGADSEQTVTTPDGALPLNQWTHVVATLTGTTARLYINGNLSATNTALNHDPISFGPTSNNWLGRSQWGSGDGYFNGKLDQLKIYNYALSTIEVGQDYLADTLKEYLCDSENSTLGVYDFNDDCIINLVDFANLAARWMEDDRIHAE